MKEKYSLPWYSETIDKNQNKQNQYEAYCDLSLEDLVKEYSKVVGPGDQILDSTKYNVLLGIIADKLCLFTRETLEVFFWEEFGGIYKRLDELETITKTHRHRLDVAYGEKPVW